MSNCTCIYNSAKHETANDLIYDRMNTLYNNVMRIVKKTF